MYFCNNWLKTEAKYLMSSHLRMKSVPLKCAEKPGSATFVCFTSKYNCALHTYEVIHYDQPNLA